MVPGWVGEWKDDTLTHTGTLTGVCGYLTEQVHANILKRKEKTPLMLPASINGFF